MTILPSREFFWSRVVAERRVIELRRSGYRSVKLDYDAKRHEWFVDFAR
jgi:hypothetical protein